MRKGWEYKKLGEVCCPKSKNQRATKCFGASDEIAYIDISSIDNSVQEVNSITSFTMSNAPSRAQQKVEYGDIIVSTVRPNLKNVALIKQHDSNLVASSGFCVLRTTDDIERNYLFRYITSDIFTQHLMKLTTGANYPAVRDLDVRDSTIPLPPKSTQLAIVSELDKINELIRLKKEQLKDFDNLAQSLFYEMCGDPVENEKGWEVKKLGEIGEVKTGNTPSRSNDNFYNEKFIEWIKTDNIRNEQMNPTTAAEYLSKEGAECGRIAGKGSILVACIAGSLSSIGKCCITTKNVAFNQQINAITPYGDFCNSIYLYELIRNSSKYIQQNATTGMKHILSKSIFEKLKFPLPPLPLQRLFAQRIEQIEREKSEVQKSIQDLETLLASRMQYWFE